MSTLRTLALGATLAAALPLSAHAVAPAAAAAPVASKDPMPATDPYLWLEDVGGDKPLAWVRAQNALTEARYASTPEFKRLEGDIRAILDSDAKIPAVEKIGAHYYNFWKDAKHERGLWRRTTLAEYRKPKPLWETVLDLDALNRAENIPDGKKWVWHGADCLKPDYTRCLIALSPGGSDADVTREFDLTTKTWVKDGFFRKEAKGGLQWIDRDSVYVFTDFGKDAQGRSTLTEAGYPRIVKQWQRGTPIASATTVYEGGPEDMYIAAMRDHTRGFERDFVSRTIAFYNDELYLRGTDGKLTKIDAPNSTNKTVHRDWLLLELREPWTIGGKSYAAGSLLATKFDAFMRGSRDFDVLFAPTKSTSLASMSRTRSHVVINVMDDVKHSLHVLTPGAKGWTRKPIPGSAAIGTLAVGAVDPDDSDALWLTSTSYLTPSTLSWLEPGKPAQPLKAMPTFFDASKHVAEQHFAVSKDGTRVPYFLVRPKQVKYDGSNPTLLYGYGGFEISLTPNYSGGVGKGWLEKGGVYAVANIRGGGEYGPAWHQAALKANRGRAYQDFAAVAQDLIARKVTSAKRLGIQGGSNGGLLTGNMLTQYPQLLGAVVVQVPLLDMQRYHQLLAGASWMAEYGDPDKPEEWKFIQTFSPYHLVRKGADYPPTLFMTSTRDDRVHPGHARKMYARMKEFGHDVHYWENIEGGHGGAANNAQAARMAALAYSFLWRELNR